MGLLDNLFFHRIWHNGVKTVDVAQPIDFVGAGVNNVYTLDGRTVVSIPGGSSTVVIDTPTALSANQNDYALSTTANVVRISTNSSTQRDITGFVAQANGRVIRLVNVGTGRIGLLVNDTLSAAANRIVADAEANPFPLLHPGLWVDLFYDGVISRWRTVYGGRPIAAAASGGLGYSAGGGLQIALTAALPVANQNITGVKLIGYNGAIAHGAMGATETIDFTLGGFHTGTLDANVTLTITAPGMITSTELKLTQDATGGRTITWPASVKNAAAINAALTTTASTYSRIALGWDETNNCVGVVTATGVTP